MNLSVSSFFFELALVFLPGFIWMKIHTRYGAKGEITQFDMILNTFIFGVICYGMLDAIYWAAGSKLKIGEIDVNSTKLLDQKIFRDVFYAMAIAVVGGIGFLYIENHKLLTRFVQKIGATRTFGDEDVWDYVFNSSSESVNFVHFRDFQQQVVYSGYVDLFSESGQLRELVLRGVTVYDFEGVEMYQMPRLYLARERENIHIEFPESPREPTIGDAP
jgi:hypothetical protein